VPATDTRHRTRRSVLGLAVLLAPTLVFLAVFTYWPLLVSLVGSFPVESVDEILK
jgi:ABC-type sugar transport system permease subunit